MQTITVSYKADEKIKMCYKQMNESKHKRKKLVIRFYPKYNFCSLEDNVNKIKKAKDSKMVLD